MKREDLKNMKVGVLGLARSGIAAANLARSLGAQVFISEIKTEEKCRGELKKLAGGIMHECGGHTPKLLDSDIVIKSPGIPYHTEIIEQIKQKNIPLFGEIEFACRLIKPKIMVAITGTNGKTTTTALTGEIFKNSGLNTVVAGNIGSPLSQYVDKIDVNTAVVLEVSSYQLEDSFEFSPDISGILNISQDHLEHHGSIEKYVKSKERIFQNQGKKDCCILNFDDAYCRKMAEYCPSKVVFFSRKEVLKNGVFVKGGRIIVNTGGAGFELQKDYNLPGNHNLENVLASIAFAVSGGLKKEVIEKTLLEFRGVEHRIEFAGKKGGIEYYNDSKATNVNSVQVALESFNKPVWLIMGGRGKGAPYGPLRGLVKEKVKGVMLIGEDAGVIRSELDGATEFYDCVNMKNAVIKASELAKYGDVILLSPACASFDQYNNYEERGRDFKEIVKTIIK